MPTSPSDYGKTKNLESYSQSPAVGSMEDRVGPHASSESGGGGVIDCPLKKGTPDASHPAKQAPNGF
jgi:hypothetical protein